MTRIEELEAKLAEIDENIRVGKRLLTAGYDCGGLLAITEALQAEAKAEYERLTK